LFPSGSSHFLALHPFPTRRSSDLDRSSASRASVFSLAALGRNAGDWRRCGIHGSAQKRGRSAKTGCGPSLGLRARIVSVMTAPRSEEYTSELQSRRDLVCRLLLEK